MRGVFRGVPVLLLLIGLSLLGAAPRARTVPLYAARTGYMCGQCHFDPNGGGPRNEFGFAYAKNRHQLTPDTTGEWKDLALVNRVGDNLPLYVGVNQRFMLFANTSLNSDSLDRIGFFNMENALHLTFQPHRRLTLVYTRDGFNDGSSTKEAFGMITGFPWDGYFKAGRIRTPFGLRMDDHTVATRDGYLDFAGGQFFMPYDVRLSDMGVEAGAQRGVGFGRIAFTNGGGDPFGLGNTRVQAVTAKLGANMPWYQGAVSFYDDYHRVADFPPPTFTQVLVSTRATRWGYYGVTHWRALALLGEVAAGTDEPGVSSIPQKKINRLAGWAELNARLTEGINVRVRADRMELNRGADTVAERDANTHDRLSLEGEFDPVPFAQIRWSARLIHHHGAGTKDEHQGFVQMHFSY